MSYLLEPCPRCGRFFAWLPMGPNSGTFYERDDGSVHDCFGEHRSGCSCEKCWARTMADLAPALRPPSAPTPPPASVPIFGPPGRAPMQEPRKADHDQALERGESVPGLLR